MHAETLAGPLEIGYEQLVVALGAVTRVLPVPGLREHGLEFKDLASAIALRNHVLGQLERAAARPERDRGARLRLRRRRLRGCRGAGRAPRPQPRGAPLLPGAPRREAALGARRRRAEDPPGDPTSARRVRSPPPREAGRRDPRLDDARVLRRPRGAALGRDGRPRPHARLDRRRPPAPAARRARAAARRARPRPRRRDAARRRTRERLGARRLHRSPEHEDAGRARPAHLPARAPPGTAAREEPHRPGGAVRLPHARAGRDARALQGHRRDSRASAARLPRLVRRADVSPVPAAPPLPKAPGRRWTGRSRSSSGATSWSSRCSATRESWASDGHRPALRPPSADTATRAAAGLARGAGRPGAARRARRASARGDAVRGRVDGSRREARLHRDLGRATTSSTSPTGRRRTGS